MSNDLGTGFGLGFRLSLRQRHLDNRPGDSAHVRLVAELAAHRDVPLAATT
ncbi:hypothetical protein [Barrientosiimonas humi]|uniref:hypothetical protein n=1 Tax=Barrientosiimonas humi TaxID=999931 RepID=UPI00147723FB|nr:hypothetical protein [Barrientosiimonas humi]